MTPGEAEHATDELRLAGQALKSAKLLLESGALEDAASRLYYSAFHASRGALAVKGRFAKTHAGLVSLYTRTFGPAPILGRLLQARNQADYEMKDFALDSKTIETMVSETEQFLRGVELFVEGELAKGPDELDRPPDG